ncbi:hypothetical protein GCM10007320_08480 [Pseudorhodoferax aquiterrae]|uniref:Ig-like domain-containing protein n=1 Tax=Pseudorhodoferax aquiterrae TaxID=747304 RepID=A0ABQ3FX35_9BURK|nr:hypothetical protein [Pseudorhodoferax aquiterrae]GHC72538.1 hypothetical protein GCM10007320_08480 [Pseudorhodoferax aquiterrae]
MATEVHYELGPSGDFATWQDARTALVALNPVANDQIVYLNVAVDVTINNNTVDWANANTDAEHPIIVRPKPGLGWRSLHPNSHSRPAGGIKLTINVGANNGLLSSNGFIFEDFLITAASTTSGRYPIYLGGTGTVRGGMRRCWINGSNSVQPLITVLRGSAVPAAFADYFLQDCVIEATGSTTLAAAVFSYNACVERNVFSGPQLAVRIAGGVGGPAIRNNVIVGDVLNEHTGNVQALSIAASGSNSVTGTYTRGGSGTSYNAGTFATGLTSAAFDAGGYRPAAGGALIDTADDSANFTLDMNGLNRSSVPDRGPFQRTAGVALPTGTINVSLPSGQTVVVTGTQTGATSGTVTLDGASDLVQSIDVGSSSYTVTFTGVPPGTYAASLLLTNSGGPRTVTGGSVTVTETTGNPTAPEAEEPAGPPEVSGVSGVATSSGTAQITATTTRSGGTLRGVVSTSATKPTTAQIDAGQTHAGVAAPWAGSQVPSSPGARAFSASGLSATQTYYAHVYHDHPDGDSAIVSSSAWTQPAVVVAPEITNQPDDLTVEDGADAVFTISFTGTAPIAVQARRDGVNVPGAVVGSGTASYTIADCDAADSGAQISFFVSNSAGSDTSDVAVLTVNAPIAAPTITTEPADDAVTEGESAVFSLEATNGGGTNTIQWFTRPQGDTGNGTAVSGATASTLTTAALALADDGREYRGRVTNEADTVYTRWARVTVDAIIYAPEITTDPQSQTRNVGQTAVFTVTANGTEPFTVDWYFKGALVSGVTGKTFTTPALAAQDNGAQVYCVVKNSAGEDTSVVAVLTVLTPVVPPVMAGSVSFSQVTHLSYIAAWGAASNSPTRYELSLNGGAWQSVGLTLTRLIEGRTPLATDTVDVRAVNNDGVSNVITGNVTLAAQPPILPPGSGGVLAGISPPALFQLLAMAGE